MTGFQNESEDKMNHWLFPANVKFYDVFAALELPETYWRMSGKVAVGDILYLYLAAPHKQIHAVCEVLDIDLPLDTVFEFCEPFMRCDGKESVASDRPFMKIKPLQKLDLDHNNPLGLSFLKENGLKGMLMGPRKLENNPTLLHYIQENMP